MLLIISCPRGNASADQPSAHRWSPLKLLHCARDFGRGRGRRGRRGRRRGPALLAKKRKQILEIRGFLGSNITTWRIIPRIVSGL